MDYYMVYDAATRVIYGIVLILLLILIIAYTLRGRKLEKSEEKRLMYGFACFFVGYLYLFFYFSFISYLITPGYYENHTYYGEIAFMMTDTYALILRVAYVTMLIGTTILIYACENYLKRTNFLMTILNSIMIALYLIFATEYITIVSLYAYFTIAQLIIITIFLSIFTKASRAEFKAISSLLFFGILLFIAALALFGPDVKKLNLVPLVLPPILYVNACIIFLIPIVLSQRYLKQARVYWILFGVISIITLIICGALFIYFQLPFAVW